MKILLVGDDRDDLDVTAYMLRRDRFAVVEASDPAQALRRFRMERPDLVVLDLALGGVVGVLRQIRAEAPTPVLVMAGRAGRQDVVPCFELGADDFITKPYVFRELALRIRAILRRVGTPMREDIDTPLEVGDLHLQPETHEVRRGASQLWLTPIEFRIFYTLAKNADHVVPSSRLLSFGWGGRAGGANSLRSHICHLRKKLALDDGQHGSIESVPAVGYVFHAVGVRAAASLEEDAGPLAARP